VAGQWGGFALPVFFGTRTGGGSTLPVGFDANGEGYTLPACFRSQRGRSTLPPAIFDENGEGPDPPVGFDASEEGHSLPACFRNQWGGPSPYHFQQESGRARAFPLVSTQTGRVRPFPACIRRQQGRSSHPLPFLTRTQEGSTLPVGFDANGKGFDDSNNTCSCRCPQADNDNNSDHTCKCRCPQAATATAAVAAYRRQCQPPLTTTTR